MDLRRLDTAGAYAAGIFSKPTPKTDIPEDRSTLSYDCWEDRPKRHVLLNELRNGTVIDCLEYYGIPVVWQDKKVYKAILLQYRAVSESHVFESAEEAIDWFLVTANEVKG